MDLRVRKPAFWASLHLRSGLHGWPLSRELALGATSDQLDRDAEEVQSRFALMGQFELQAPCSPTEALAACEAEVMPHLWMWVNPNLVCPIPGRAVLEGPLPRPLPPVGSAASPANLACPPEELLPTPSEAEKVSQEEDSSQVNSPPLQNSGDTHGPPTAAPWKSKVLRSRSRNLKRVHGGWPRPPLNYCLLISLALSSSVDCSLTVQEIYQFTRERFPFFRTAPEGWKNTVRHNLCFSSSFEKTTDFVHLEGSRKSRLWKLTTEGHRRFQEEMQGLSEDMIRLVHQSMDNPALMSTLFGL